MVFVLDIYHLTSRMQAIQTLKWVELMDMLSEQTAIYTKLLAERNRTDAFESAKKIIKQIHTEVGRRQTGEPLAATNTNELTPVQEFSGSSLTT